jgi:hypothetical protein
LIKKLEGNKPLEISHDLLEQSNGCAELLLFVFGESGNGIGQRFYAPFARRPHEADAPGRSFEADAAAVLCGVPAY